MRRNARLRAFSRTIDCADLESTRRVLSTVVYDDESPILLRTLKIDADALLEKSQIPAIFRKTQKWRLRAYMSIRSVITIICERFRSVGTQICMMETYN